MNASNSVGDNHLSGGAGDGNSIGSVSRSGRVRKKNSLLAVYESPDVNEKSRRKADKAHKNAKTVNERSHGKLQGRKQNNYQYDDGDSSRDSYPAGSYNSSFGRESFDGEVPDVAGEEVIDGFLEERNGGLVRHNKLYNSGHVRLKSQAESTYMQEKSFLKQRKITGPGHTGKPGAKVKATRKDKGSPRVTAYMLWAKEQRTTFAKKFPHMDFSSLSKKLSDLWATVPQNQKRMWKTKAAKIMRKKTNGAENMKNSAGPSVISTKKSLQVIPQRKGMKNTTPEEIFAPKRLPGRPPKKGFLPPAPVQPSPHSTKNISGRPTTSSILNAKASTSTTKQNTPSSQSSVTVEASKLASFDFRSVGTQPIDVAAHLSLLGESMKKLGAQLQNAQDQPVNESLSSLLDSLLCSVGPLLCLTQVVPEMACIPESQLKQILNNLDFIMPGL